MADAKTRWTPEMRGIVIVDGPHSGRRLDVPSHWTTFGLPYKRNPGDPFDHEATYLIYQAELYDGRNTARYQDGYEDPISPRGALRLVYPATPHEDVLLAERFMERLSDRRGFDLGALNSDIVDDIMVDVLELIAAARKAGG